jgi:hypothetical protein
MNFQAAWSTRRGRIRIILIGVILATIPFYCLGFTIIISRENDLEKTTLTPGWSATPTKFISITSTPPTLVYFPSATITRTPTITISPSVTRTFALSPTSTPTMTPTLTDIPTLESTMTDTITIAPTDTETVIPTEEFTPTP